MFSSLFLREAFCCEEKKERSGQLKYILRKKVERIYGKSDGFPTFLESAKLVKNSLLVH